MDIKKDIERLLLFLIPAIIIERILATVSSTIFTSVMGNSTSRIEEMLSGYSIGELFTVASTINAIAALVPTFIIAVWLWKLEKRTSGRHVLWALGAVVLKYWVLLLYIGQLIYNKDSRLESEKT